jgi:hypothetical protein
LIAAPRFRQASHQRRLAAEAALDFQRHRILDAQDLRAGRTRAEHCETFI